MELINKINSLNNEVKRLNNERNVALGKKETLTQQLNQGLADYNAKFQTNISVDTIEAELTKVSGEVKAKVNKLETAITQIKSGNFTEANSTLEIKTPEFSEPMETGRVTAADAPITPEVAAMVVPPPAEDSIPAQSEVPVAPVQPTAPSEPERPAPAERPAPDAASFLDMLNLAPGEVPAQPSAAVGGGMSFAAKAETVAEPSVPTAPAEPKLGLPPTNFTAFMGV
jgi:uncharacterized phage infection (PIP) family protein YhgE